MNKFILRMIGTLLVFCLMADSAPAAAGVEVSSRPALMLTQSHSSGLFLEEAFAIRLRSFPSSFTSRITSALYRFIRPRKEKAPSASRLFSETLIGNVWVPSMGRFFSTENTFNPKDFSTTMFLSFIQSNKWSLKGKRVLVIGTGSGILAIALARKDARVTAIDISAEAVATAKKNILTESDAVREKTHFLVSNVYDELPDLSRRGFDFIVANHPFDKIPAPPGRASNLALYAGSDFQTIHRILDDLKIWLSPGGEALVFALASPAQDLAQGSLSDYWTTDRLLERVPVNIRIQREGPLYDVLTESPFREEGNAAQASLYRLKVDTYADDLSVLGMVSLFGATVGNGLLPHRPLVRFLTALIPFAILLIQIYHEQPRPIIRRLSDLTSAA